MRDINTLSSVKDRIFSIEFWKSILGYKKIESESPEVSRHLQEKNGGQGRTESRKVDREALERSLVRSELNLEKNAIFTVSTYRGKSRKIELPPERGAKGEFAKRTIIIGKTGQGIETGVLTTNHFKVYLVLIELWEKAGRPVDEPVHFTAYRIIRRLDLQDDGRTYRRIRQSLYDLRQIPIEFIHSFYIPEQGTFSTLEPFTILNHLRIYERRKVGKLQKTRGYGEFQFDRYILENLANNHVHPLRLDVIKSFKKHRDMAVLLYTYVDRNLAFKVKFEIGLESLFDHLDLSQSYVRYPAERKRVLDPVLEQLRGKELSSGILSYSRIHKTADGKDYKLVCRKKPFPKRLSGPKPTRWDMIELPEVPDSESAKSSSELLLPLVEKGLTQKQAAKLIAEKDPKVISDQLEYLPFRLKEYGDQGREINEPAILYESINDNWKVPRTYVEAEKAKEREAERLERERLARLEREKQDKAEQERMKLEAYKGTLDPEKREKLRERALEKLRRMEGIKEEFISDVLIEAQENEILRLEMEDDKR